MEFCSCINCMRHEVLPPQPTTPVTPAPLSPPSMPDDPTDVGDAQLSESVPVTHIDSDPIIPILTIPQPHPSFPPRPEFTPFTVPNLGGTVPPHDGTDFWDYPTRHNWTIHARDEQCHVLCPPGLCWDGVEWPDTATSESAMHTPMISRTDGSPVTPTDKAAFLQSWLFFGTLAEMSALCHLDLDVSAEFLLDNGKTVSTSALNGLAARWIAALDPSQIGDEKLMERILALARHVCLLSVQEYVEDAPSSGSDETHSHSHNPERMKSPGLNYQPRYTYTVEECRVLHSIDILARTLGLHLLLHVYSPRFKASDDKGWGKKRITRSIHWLNRRIEGVEQLSDIVFDDMNERGWCISELYLMDSEEQVFASLLDRPRARRHSSCNDTVCYAYQTDDKTYKTVHVHQDCKCDFVGVRTEDLVESLVQDKVPVVMITAELDIRVVSSDKHPYIALSHVCESPAALLGASSGILTP
ncbi:hypothetical protein C8Q76DRAFT_846299 [Earliella scabrosa]|nr:hypothetical protein C8Q76DRAFT_846299 [Earliella scabrosa]